MNCEPQLVAGRWCCPRCGYAFKSAAVKPPNKRCLLPGETWSAVRREPAANLTGPGSELKQLLAELGQSVTVDCGCEDKAHQMNVWGVAGCREHRAEIIAWLQEAAAAKGWAASLAAQIASGWLVDEAIRRAEVKSAALTARPTCR